MQDVYHEGGHEGALEELEMALELPANLMNSKLMKVMKNDCLMLILMHAILPLGHHYWKRHRLSVCWLSQAMNVIMRTALSLLVDKIKAAEDGDVATFIPVIDEINKLAIQCFDTYEECIGDNNNNYVNTISLMNTLGMPAFVSTGWDWRHSTIRKNMEQSVEPSVQAIIMELEFTQMYQPYLLQDHKVWQLHEQLHEHMLWDGIIVLEPPAKSDITDDTYMSEEELLRRWTIALEIPALEGVRDTYTVYMKDDLDEEKDLIIHAAAGTNAEEPLPKKNLPKPTPIQMTLTFKDKGKAKATTPDPVIKHEDILVTVFEQEHTLALVLEDAHIPISIVTHGYTLTVSNLEQQLSWGLWLEGTLHLYRNLESNTPAITAENQKHLENVALKVSSINKELYQYYLLSVISDN
ncbi:hypothetical protein C8R48DRAFT_672812 [Suillus tomentosus]|nr:hypothetical protein C8R48DRAFT_672812 [Suillus tomentosus]